MKRQTQAIGVRDWYGMDFLSLQEEPLKVLDNFFTQYGSFIVSGCEITPNGSNYDISPGLVALEGPGADGTTVKVVAPFAGMTNTILPVYITLECETQTDVYHDGKVKPIINIYKAVASTVQPAGPSLLFMERTPRFVDVLQNSTHRFVTDTEKTAWNAKAPNRLATPSQSGMMSATDKLKLDRCSTECGVTFQTTYTPTSLNYTVPLSRLLSFDSTDGIWKTSMVDASGLSQIAFNGEVPLASSKPANIYVLVRKSMSAPLQIGFSSFMMSKVISIAANYTLVFLHFVRNGNFYHGININAF